MIPGVYPALSNADYHASEGVSKSGLALCGKCPALYKARYIDGVASKQTPAMIIGSAVHTATLEPEKFDDEYVNAPVINRRTNAGKIEWSEFQADNVGKVVLSANDYQLVKNMADAVHNHPVAGNILADGIAEQSIYHVDEKTGEIVKCRPDWITGNVIVDLKTTQDASPEAFSKACYNFTYHVQTAMYMAVSSAEMKIEFESFIFIAVEKSEGHQVAVYYADDDMVNLGYEEYRRMLNKYHECRVENCWPGYGNDEISPVSLPGWCFKK